MAAIIGLVGSPREGNTKVLVEAALKEAEAVGLTTELVHLGKMNIAPCKVCDKCQKEERCVQEDDFQQVAEKLAGAQGVVVGSPVYFGGVSAQLKAFMDRTRYLRRKEVLKDKVGGAIAVGAARNGGQETTIQQIHNFLFIQGMIVVSDEESMHYGGTGYAKKRKEAEEDKEGLKTSRNLGRHVASVVKKLIG